MAAGPNYDKDDPGNQPKNILGNPEFFAKNRTILGNLITKNMKITGGGDIDWLIEHNDHFIILEIKEFHDDVLVFTRGQMIAFEKLYEKLESCSFFFVGHDNIDFSHPSDPIWFFDMKYWLTRLKSESFLHNKKYVIKKSCMKPIDVKIFRDILDAAWGG